MAVEWCIIHWWVITLVSWLVIVRSHGGKVRQTNAMPQIGSPENPTFCTKETGCYPWFPAEADVGSCWSVTHLSATSPTSLHLKYAENNHNSNIDKSDHHHDDNSNNSNSNTNNNTTSTPSTPSTPTNKNNRKMSTTTTARTTAATITYNNDSWNLQHLSTWGFSQLLDFLLFHFGIRRRKTSSGAAGSVATCNSWWMVAWWPGNHGGCCRLCNQQLGMTVSRPVNLPSYHPKLVWLLSACPLAIAWLVRFLWQGYH